MFNFKKKKKTYCSYMYYYSHTADNVNIYNIRYRYLPAEQYTYYYT